eukprot:Opistho-2@36320
MHGCMAHKRFHYIYTPPMEWEIPLTLVQQATQAHATTHQHAQRKESKGLTPITHGRTTKISAKGWRRERKAIEDGETHIYTHTHTLWCRLRLLGTSGNDFRGGALRVLCKVVVEQCGEFVLSGLELGLVLPCVGRIEDLRGHAGARRGNLNVEHIVVHKRCLCEFAVVDRINNGARVRELDAAANAVLAAAPARVDEPAVDAVLLHLLCKHCRVFGRVPHKEGLSKAGRERCSGLSHALLRPRNLCSVSTDKVVHGLFCVEPRHRRKHSKGIAREQHNVRRMASQAGDLGVGNVLDGVGGARVLRDGSILEINLARVLIVDDILHDGSEANGVVDLGLFFLRKIDGLGIATALNVEHAVVRPAVLVVANEIALGIRRQCRLAGATQAKEQSDIAIRPLVGARVKRKHAGLGHQVVHDRKHALLHLSRILRAQNDHFAAPKVKRNARGARHALCVTIGREFASVVNCVIGLAKVLELLHSRADEHIVHEECVVCARTHDTDLNAVAGIPSCEAIKHVEALPRVQKVHSTLAIDHKRSLIELDVDRSPPDITCTRWLNCDALVSGAAAGLGSRSRRKGPRRGDVRPLFIAQSLLIKERRRSVVDNAVCAQTVILKVGANVGLIVDLVEARLHALIREQGV